MYSLTAIPFGVYSTPISERFNEATFARLPTAISTLSASTVSSLPFLLNLTFKALSVASIESTCAWVWMSMSRLPRLCLRRLARSVSNLGRMSLQYSRTVTSLPKLLNIEANSRPMTPPPITHNLCGISSTSRISLDVNTPRRSFPGIGRVADTDPVATIM